MGRAPFVLAIVIAVILPFLLGGHASASPPATPAVAIPSAHPRPHTPATPAPAHAGPGLVPLSGVVAAGRPPSLDSGPGLGPTAAMVAPVTLHNTYRVTNNAAQQNEVSIAVNPLNPKNIVASANDYRGGDGWCGVYATHDGGITWYEQLIPKTGDLGALPAGGDPAVAFDANGNVYQSCLSFTRSPYRVTPASVIAVSKSTDGGITWGNPVTVVSGPEYGSVFNDKDYLAVDRSNASTRGNVYVTWTRFINNSAGYIASPIVLSRSTDGGATWSNATDITTAGYADDQGSEPVVGPGGELYVSWLSYSGGEKAVVRRSLDGGLTWGPIVSAGIIFDSGVLFPGADPGGNPRTPDFPVLAVNPISAPTGNRLHMVWADRRFGTTDILMVTSVNNGTTWGPVVRVNEATTMNVHFFAWVSASQTGRVDVEFYGGWNDPGNHRIADFYASSYDFGASFAFNAQVSPYFSLDSYPGNWFIGDYNGIASFGWNAYPAWCDVTNPRNSEIYMAGEGYVTNAHLVIQP